MGSRVLLFAIVCSRLNRCCRLQQQTLPQNAAKGKGKAAGSSFEADCATS